ncbi:MAG: FAD-binding oxidoreductase [Aurantimicrobium sp.]|nr:FAD-binding oxidoreductase [Aurantimicrobium sp.]
MTNNTPANDSNSAHDDSARAEPVKQSGSLTRRTLIAGGVAAAGALVLAACAPVGTSVLPTSTARTVRKITPPRLDTAYLGEEILCYRPMRRGAPNMSAETVGSQIIAHNYGHGGSGWTLAPGTAKYVVDLVEDTEGGAIVSKGEPVIVVGAGVIGLFTAYELVQRGYSNITVMAERFEKITSDNAGGLLAPVSMDNAPEIQAIIDQIGIDAYRFFAAVAQGDQPDFAGGAKIVPSYFETREESGLEPYVGQVMQPAKDVVVDFGNGTTRDMVVYDDGIFIDTALMMEELHSYLESRVTFVEQKVLNFADLPNNLVFDCAGLGSGALNGDAEVVSVQGHLIMLKDQVPADMEYMILVYFDEGVTEANQKVKRSLYVFPKSLPGTGPNDIGVVGGTFVEGGTPETPNLSEYATMLQGAKDYYGIA